MRIEKTAFTVATLFLCLLFMASVLSCHTVLAYGYEGKYISEIAVREQDDGSGWLEENGYSVIDADIGKDGRHIFIGYKSTFDYDKTVTGILFLSEDHGNSYKAGNVSYNFIGDCNGEAFIYVTSDLRVGEPLSELCVDKEKSITNWETSEYEDGHGTVVLGDGYYFHYKQSGAGGASVFSDPSVVLPILVIIIVVIGAIVIAITKDRRRIA